MPSLPPDDVAALDRAHPLEAGVRDVDPLRVRARHGRRCSRGSSTCAKRTWMPSMRRAEHARRRRASRAARASTSMPFSPPITVTFLTITPCARDDDAALTTAPGFADEVLSAVDHERPLVDARARGDGRRPGRERDAAAPRARTAADGRAGRGARPAELAAVLRVRESQQRQHSVAEQLRERARRRRRTRARQTERRAMPDRAAPSAITTPSSSAPSGSAAQPGW